MPMHIVQQGECLASIAKENGFADWRTIYNDDQNAEFRQKRPNPNILFPGDQLFIPDKTPKEENRSAGATHSFKIKSQKTLFRVRIMDEKNQPIANKQFKLVVQGDTLEGTTGADGLIEKEIPAAASQGELTI